MTLDEIRRQIDETDTKMKELFLHRMQLSGQIARIKAKSGDDVYKPDREQQLIERLTAGLDPEAKEAYSEFLRRILELSRTSQYKIIAGQEATDDCQGEGQEAGESGQNADTGESICLSLTDPGDGSMILRALTIVRHHGFKTETIEKDKGRWKISITPGEDKKTQAEKNALIRHLQCEAGCSVLG